MCRYGLDQIFFVLKRCSCLGQRHIHECIPGKKTFIVCLRAYTPPSCLQELFLYSLYLVQYLNRIQIEGCRYRLNWQCFVQNIGPLPVALLFDAEIGLCDRVVPYVMLPLSHVQV